jgi:CDP-paratose 2-epimerase
LLPLAETILVTGGAGFIGSSLAVGWKQRSPADRVIAFDNLRRRGTELNVARLRDAGVEFQHGDIRIEPDLSFVRNVDVILECSAEPSVMAGRDGQTRFVVDTNLVGCVNCLELARAAGAAMIFLSTSRVYPTETLSRLNYEPRGGRFVLTDAQPVAGASAQGISEAFPLDGVRTLYGATKLAAELLIAEYVDMFGIRAVINRCGVVSGPWQMGHAEQGVFAHWMFAHVFGRRLAYIGYGGTGQQVRDVMHVDDLGDLIRRQLDAREKLRGEIYNAGGGLANCASLAEFTDVCAEVTGRRLDIASQPETRPGDVPIYVTDNSKVQAAFGWQPRRNVRQIAADLHSWITAHADALQASLSLRPKQTH